VSQRTTLDTRSPTTSTSTSTDRTLWALAQVTDERTVETLLQGFLTRRRAVRRARREQAAAQARHEHEMLVQRAMIGSGLANLR
jgi:hypothetical protein